MVVLLEVDTETGVDMIAYNYDVGVEDFMCTDMHGGIKVIQQIQMRFTLQMMEVYLHPITEDNGLLHLNAGYKTMQAYDATVGP